MHDLPESTTKITEVVKADGITDCLDGEISFQKLSRSHTDPVIPEIECRRYSQDILEAAKAFTFADQGRIGDILCGKVLGIAPLNESAHFLHTFFTSVG